MPQRFSLWEGQYFHPSRNPSLQVHVVTSTHPKAESIFFFFYISIITTWIQREVGAVSKRYFTFQHRVLDPQFKDPTEAIRVLKAI